jgi:DNA mismatch repair protein MutS2
MDLDERTLHSLEYDKIRELVAAQAACSLGKQRARALMPSADAEAIEGGLREAAEARALMGKLGPFPFGGLTDVSPLVARARIGAVLEGEELNRVQDALRALRRMRAYLLGAADDGPSLQPRAESLGDHSELETSIRDSLDDDGNVVDTASPELAALRRRIQTTHSRIRSRLDEMLASPALQRVLQDRLSTIRSGRYCVPIKSQYQNDFAGIIHDRSDSGATVFMEPQAIVPLGNELRQAEFDEQQEVLRILKSLSAAVGQAATDILRDLYTWGEVDLISAMARRADAMHAEPPDLDDTGYLSLMAARHPLLKGDVVPIDLYLGREFRVLLITGPNTGGKTVTLKTAGLLCLMAQSGLHLPAARGSRVPVFTQVFADIGDEQSIEQNLSTFSSHMGQIIAILRRLQTRALVLLDEIGAGTDPSEGAALAQAILEALLQERTCRVVATTHSNDLKAFAYATDGIENACVEFDLETLQPTFHLAIGVPGSSNAFEVALRLGLQQRIVDRARQQLGKGRRSIESIIRRVQRLRIDSRAEVAALEAKYEAELAHLEAQRDDSLRRSYEEAEEIVRRAEEEAVRIIGDLQRQSRQSKRTQQAREELMHLREVVAEEKEAALEPEPEPAGPPPDIRPGDLVRVRGLDQQGVALSAPVEGHVTVQMGPMRLDAEANDLELVEAYEDERVRDAAGKLRLQKSLETRGEIYLRGMTVDEGIAELDKYLDDVFLSGQQSVRIVHGKGTGALRRGIHEYLRQHPHVKSFTIADRDAGGEGVTVVNL